MDACVTAGAATLACSRYVSFVGQLSCMDDVTQTQDKHLWAGRTCWFRFIGMFRVSLLLAWIALFDSWTLLGIVTATYDVMALCICDAVYLLISASHTSQR